MNKEIRDMLSIIESLAMSQNVKIITTLPKRHKALKKRNTALICTCRDKKKPAWIYLPPKDLRSRFLIPNLSHELGHFFSNRDMTTDEYKCLLIGEVLRTFGLQLDPSFDPVLWAEKEAWKRGHYILLSLGLLTKEIRKDFSIAKRNSINTYRGIQVPKNEDEWK